MGSTRNTTANLLTLAEKDAEEDRPWGQIGHDLPRTHVPPTVGAVVAQPAQQRAVNLANVLSAHDLVWGPFCTHTDGLANAETKNGKQKCLRVPSNLSRVSHHSGLMGSSQQETLGTNDVRGRFRIPESPPRGCKAE